MATAHQTPPRNTMSRLAIFASRQPRATPGPSSPLSRDLEEREEDWYIPYNGPYEPPKASGETRDSWGELLNGLLSENSADGRGSRSDGRASHAASAPDQDDRRSRAVSGASRMTSTDPAGSSSRRNTVGRRDRQRSSPQPRLPTLSYIDLYQSGGVGESPKHVERTPSQPVPSTSQAGPRPSTANRNSLASIFTFGRKSLRLSASMDNLSRERSNSRTGPPLPTTTASTRQTPNRPRGNTTSTATPVQGRLSPEEEYYNTYYSTLLTTPGREVQAPPRSEEGESMRSHPYAYPFPAAKEPLEPQSAPPVDKGKGRLLVPRITLLDPRGPKVPDFLKPSPRNSVLKASMSTPNLRNLPKGKQKWLSAETWCDAIILPRPRFAMRLIEEGPGAQGSGRIVSPPPSPLMSNHKLDPQVSITQRPSLGVQKSLKKARSMGNLTSTPSSTPESSQRRAVGPVASTSAAPPPAVPVQAPQAGSSALKPPRPKSWAWDDLALPSPAPSLAKVLADGQQLEDDRRTWKKQANRSYLDKRAGTISRARSKSIGAGGRSRSRAHSHERTTAFEALAERTLLGGQVRPPTIHVHGPPPLKGGRTYTQSFSQGHSQSHNQTFTQTGTTSSSYHPFPRPGSRPTRSHAHSNSLGQTTYNSSKESRTLSHARSHSLGKSAFRIVVNTATSAAALCGFTGGDNHVLTPDSEKAEALEGAIYRPGTKHIRLHDQIRAEEKRKEMDNLLTIARSPSAMLAMLDRNGTSPTPSGNSGSGEGVGIAITSATADQHARTQGGREPIRFPKHPYALNAAYAMSSSQPVQPHATTALPQASATQQRTTSPLRQPVLLNPYSQPSHPYATAPHPPQPHRPDNIQPPPPHLKLYAEITPNHVREFAPEDVRYSPDIPTPVVVKPPTELGAPATSSHPYGGPESKRTSELGFGEALIHTLHRTSIDSGLGTSEAENFDTVDWNLRPSMIRPDSAMDDIIRIHEAPHGHVTPGRPSPAKNSSGGGISLNNTTASSPPENLNPPLFRRAQSGLSAGRSSLGTHFGNSSGSSPGMVSHDSSPPLSPRVINTSDDLDRFRDLFYRPDRQSRAYEETQRPSMGSRQGSGSIILDVGSQRSTRSGLSTLARQLSEELEELRQEYGTPDTFDEPQRSWGRRYGGLRGPRPEGMEDNPNVVLARISTSPEGDDSPMRMPIDITFVSPPSNIPEDVQSSRASSIMHTSPIADNEAIHHFRLGEVEAVSTPPIINTPARFSAELSLVGHDVHDVHEDNTLRVNVRHSNRHSERSIGLSPMSPFTPNTRSSYRTSGTDTSRMSGLSDFPAPPSLLPPSSRLAYTSTDSDRPRLERESSYATFGRADDEYSIGQAL
ncbi:hypothetical protein BDW22DRAFT_1363405 [Trametopsis cervina]|nr:hypothetical protein BDW22DRAFT_1363405 [Trametopsis cervina]